MSEALQRLLESPEFTEGQAWQRRDYAEHQQIIAEGEIPTELFLLLTGTVRVVGSVALDNKRTVHPGYSDLEAGALFGEMSVFDDAPRSGSVVAVSNCTLAAVNAQALLDYMDAHPETGYLLLKEIIETLIMRLRKANQRVASLFAWGLKAHGIDEEL